MRSRHFLLAAAAVTVLAACGSSTLAPLPLGVQVHATPTTAAIGDSISFVVLAQGGALVGVEILFGDGETDLYGTGGARTARITFKHAYADAGTFTVRATVTDAVVGQKESTTEVVVQ